MNTPTDARDLHAIATIKQIANLHQACVHFARLPNDVNLLLVESAINAIDPEFVVESVECDWFSQGGHFVHIRFEDDTHVDVPFDLSKE